MLARAGFVSAALVPAAIQQRAIDEMKLTGWGGI